MKKTNNLRTWIEIDQKALTQNVRILKNTSKNDFMAILKANAYGHGLEEIVSVLKNTQAIDWFGVFDFNDALYIRSRTKKSVLVLWATSVNFWHEAQKKNISITLATYAQLNFLLQNANKFKNLKIHIKVDTGLTRQGFRIEDIQKVIQIVSKLKYHKIEGLYTHFSGTESKKFDSYTKKQTKELFLWKNSFNEIGQYPKIHANATSGALHQSLKESDINRFGIGLFGLFPSEEIKKQFSSTYPFTPVLSWKTKISELKRVPKGSHVAYDCTYRTKKDSVLAVLPIGYWDGFPRNLSSRGFVLIKGKKASIVGRIMMNMCIVDVSNIQNIKEGDVVVLLGKDGKESISAEDISSLSNTINYEIVTRINPLIKRLLV